MQTLLLSVPLQINFRPAGIAPRRYGLQCQNKNINSFVTKILVNDRVITRTMEKILEAHVRKS